MFFAISCAWLVALDSGTPLDWASNAMAGPIIRASIGSSSSSSTLKISRSSWVSLGVQHIELFALNKLNKCTKSAANLGIATCQEVREVNSQLSRQVLERLMGFSRSRRFEPKCSSSRIIRVNISYSNFYARGIWTRLIPPLLWPSLSLLSYCQHSQQPQEVQAQRQP